jgi:putative peptidoglycan lipid II flippase
MKVRIDHDSPQTLKKSTVSFISGTLFSRVGGLVRDMSMAFCFGTHPAIAAFMVAFRFANLLRRIFGEGALLNSFIPHFESHRKENPLLAAQFFRDIFFSLIVVVGGSILCIEAGLYSWLKWGSLGSDNREIVSLTMIMLPGLLFICLFSLCSGLLQCERFFFLIGIAPVAFNGVWICAVWILKEYEPQEAVIGLSIAITLALCFQWLVTFPKSLSLLSSNLSWKNFFQCQLFSPEVRKTVSAIFLGILGVSAAQINSAIDTLFARYASLEGPAYLNYAIHLQQLPLALFGIGIASALLPPLSRNIKKEDFMRYKELLYFALSRALLFLLPCSFAIFALGGASVNLIYGRGDFGEISTMQTTLCLWGYGVGLTSMGIAILITPAFHARKEYWIPTLASLLSITMNIVLNILLVFILRQGAASLAISTSIAACFNSGFLLYQLSKKYQIKLIISLLSFSWKTVLCAGMACGITVSIGHFFLQDPTVSLLLQGSGYFTRHVGEQFLQFGTLLSLFLFTFLLSAWLFQVKEIFALFTPQKMLPSTLLD